MNEKIKGYKGFDKDLKCRDFQYKVGETYEIDSEIKCCENGFHFCKNPFEVFSYYSPSYSRYCEVEGEGKIDNDNSKVACSKIKIGAEIGIAGIVNAGVKFILDKVDWTNKKESNTGNCSAATNTGYCSAATVERSNSVAIVTGFNSKAKGVIGCWIVLTERDENYKILDVKAFKVDGTDIKENTFYTLVNGKAKEVE